MSQAFLEDPPYLRAAHERSRRPRRLHRLRRHGPLAGHVAGDSRPRPAGRLVQRAVALLGHGDLAGLDGRVHLWEFRVDHPLVNLRVLANRNFALGTLLITVVGVVLYSTTALLPLFLQGLMGYPALNSGMAISPRGLGAIIALMVVGRLVGKIDVRVLMTFGFCRAGVFLLAIRLDQPGDRHRATWPGRTSSPASPWASCSCPSPPPRWPAAQRADGQRHGDLQPHAQYRRQHRHLAGHDAGGPQHPDPPGHDGRPSHALRSAVPALPSHAHRRPAHYGNPAIALRQAYEALGGKLLQQAILWGYVDTFRVLTFLCVLCVPLVWMLGRTRLHGGPAAVH